MNGISGSYALTFSNSEDETKASIRKLFVSFLGNIDLSSYDHTHRVRLIETLIRMSHLLSPDQRIVELGGMSQLAKFLALSTGAEVSDYTNDLRFPLDLGTSTYDLVLMLEVLEHLNDRHSVDSKIPEIAMFTGSGARSCMNEVYRILKPGGHVVLTTPNAHSVDALSRVLLKKHPFQYVPHVREYALSDVTNLAKQCGFEVKEISTFFAWNPLPGIDRESLLKLIASLGFEASDRGDDTFCILQKPF